MKKIEDKIFELLINNKKEIVEVIKDEIIIQVIDLVIFYKSLDLPTEEIYQKCLEKMNEY